MLDATWVSDIRANSPRLFDLIFELQDHAYRRNRATGGVVWTREAFVRRSEDYVIFGRLPLRDEDGRYSTVRHAMGEKSGFVLARFMPRSGPPYRLLKLSGMAGDRAVIMESCRSVLGLGIPVVAAIEPRLTRSALAVGFERFPPTLARHLLPLFARAFVVPPWVWHGVGPRGELRITNPDFRYPATGEPIVYAKDVVVSSAFVRSLLRPSEILATARFILGSIAGGHSGRRVLGQSQREGEGNPTRRRTTG